MHPPDIQRSQNLVFTSAGDRSNVRAWLRGRKDFDLWVIYYGDRHEGLREGANLYGEHKGSKFQNLHYCYQQQPDLFRRYDAVLVMDDDVVIKAGGITRLFEIRRDFDLWVLQPAFRLGGKISWDITRVQPATKLRYTNFVEMTCPLFRRDKLDEFMAVYDPELVGHGIDWWFLQTIGGCEQKRVAVVDEVTCVNPFDFTKGGVREIDRLQPKLEREQTWQRIQARYGLAQQGRVHKEFGRIGRSRPGVVAGGLRYAADWALFRTKILAGRLVRSVVPASDANKSA